MAKPKKALIKLINRLLKFVGLQLAPRQALIYLHNYSSYEEYKQIQIYHNKRKIDKVWADEATLSKVAAIVTSNSQMPRNIKGLCHGSRNGYEVNALHEILGEGSIIIGTDISDTANNFKNMINWDFHEIKEEWIGKFDFIYTNSLDQSCKPVKAIQVWLQQLRRGGLLIIEHTYSHGVEGASEMDPFGIQPEFMPYFLVENFGKSITIEIAKTMKTNKNIECWLFILSPT